MVHKKPTVAITGASGFVGSFLVSHFENLGWNVRGLVRVPGIMHPPSKQLTYYKYDIGAPISLEILRGVDYLIHAAYIPEKDSPNAYEQNILGASALIKVARSAHVRKLLFISSMSSHEKAISTYGKQKQEIEKLFHNAGGVCVRPGLIIGDGGIAKNMVTFMRRWHVVPLINNGVQPVQIISIRDLATCIERIFERNTGGLLTLATPTAYTYRQFYEAISRQKNIAIVFIRAPYNFLALLFKIAAILHLPLKLGVDNLRGLKTLKSVDTKHDLALLGVKLESLHSAVSHTKL